MSIVYGQYFICLLSIVNFLMSIVYSELYVASKILKSILHNIKFILVNYHVFMSMDISTLFFLKKVKSE